MNGIIYAHEHVTIALSGVKNDEDCRLFDKELAVNEFMKFKERGVTAVIDQTCTGMERNMNYFQGIGDDPGIKTLHVTGFYKEPLCQRDAIRWMKAV